MVLPSKLSTPLSLGVSPNKFSTSCLDNCAYILDSKFLINLASVVFSLSLSISSWIVTGKLQAKVVY